MTSLKSSLDVYTSFNENKQHKYSLKFDILLFATTCVVEVKAES